MSFVLCYLVPFCWRFCQKYSDLLECRIPFHFRKQPELIVVNHLVGSSCGNRMVPIRGVSAKLEGQRLRIWGTAVLLRRVRVGLLVFQAGNDLGEGCP